MALLHSLKHFVLCSPPHELLSIPQNPSPTTRPPGSLLLQHPVLPSLVVFFTMNLSCLCICPSLLGYEHSVTKLVIFVPGREQRVWAVGGISKESLNQTLSSLKFNTLPGALGAGVRFSCINR